MKNKSMNRIDKHHKIDPKIAILPIAGYAMLALCGLDTAAVILHGVVWGVIVAGGAIMAAIGFGSLFRSLKIDPLDFVVGTMATLPLLALAAAGATMS